MASASSEDSHFAQLGLDVPSSANCTNSTSRTVAEREVELDDIARLGRILSGARSGDAGGEGLSCINEDDDHGDKDLQKALALSLQHAQRSSPSKPLLTGFSNASKPSSKDQVSPEPARTMLAERLHKTNFLDPSDPRFAHGRLYDGPLQSPSKIWESHDPPRKDHFAPQWLTASE